VLIGQTHDVLLQVKAHNISRCERPVLSASDDGLAPISIQMVYHAATSFDSTHQARLGFTTSNMIPPTSANAPMTGGIK
jgi:hypothetical protein